MMRRLTHCPHCHNLTGQTELPEAQRTDMLKAATAFDDVADPWFASAWTCDACGCPYLVLIPSGLSDLRWSELSGRAVVSAAEYGRDER